ncbi:MAG: hypothetical protein BGO55_03375 [Sphingobacteriales bacterium 50-39]|nr:MAG: hypothetical protein BGO55_03375 [Sphingobacteriales bacterium 50-39]
MFDGQILVDHAVDHHTEIIANDHQQAGGNFQGAGFELAQHVCRDSCTSCYVFKRESPMAAQGSKILTDEGGQGF